MQRRNWHEHFHPRVLARRGRALADAADAIDHSQDPVSVVVAVLRVSALDAALKALSAQSHRGYNVACALAPLYGDLPESVRATLERDIASTCPGADVRALLLRCTGDVASDAVFSDTISGRLAFELATVAAAAVSLALRECPG